MRLPPVLPGCREAKEAAVAIAIGSRKVGMFGRIAERSRHLPCRPRRVAELRHGGRPHRPRRRALGIRSLYHRRQAPRRGRPAEIAPRGARYGPGRAAAWRSAGGARPRTGLHPVRRETSMRARSGSRSWRSDLADLLLQRAHAAGARSRCRRRTPRHDGKYQGLVRTVSRQAPANAGWVGGRCPACPAPPTRPARAHPDQVLTGCALECMRRRMFLSANGRTLRRNML